jgi:hypothetical protein
MKNLRKIREEKAVWEKPNPVKNHSKLSPSDKARARNRARSAGRPYPNMVDNIWAARKEETVQESGGDVVFKSNQGHIEKYSEHSYAVYRNGQKQTFYTSLQDAKSALKEAKEKQEYDYEGDMARSQLRSIIANAQAVHDMLKPDTNMAEWVQSKITLAADYISTAADYMQSEKGEVKENTSADRFKKYIRPVVKTTPKIERSTEPAGRTSDHVEWKVTGPTGEIRRFKSKKEADAHYNSFSEAAPAWTRKEGKSPSGGLNAKGIASYRRANPGSKLSMAVTTPPSKLDPDGKAAGRRRSFCARMGGSKGPMKDEKGRPTRKALALRKWNC